MSAFIVSRAHIDALVSAGLRVRPRGLAWWVRGDRFELSHETATRVGEMLWTENHRSVEHRYGPADALRHFGPRERYTFRASAIVDPVVLLKQIDCYEYQTCERDDWPASEAHAFCQALRRLLVSTLPGYDAAPWGIGDDDDEQAAREADADHRIKYRIENPEEVDFT